MVPKFDQSFRAVALFLPLAVWAAPQRPSVIQIVPSASWQLAGSEKLSLDTVRQWGGDPAIEREYGVKFLERQVYREGPLAVVVIAERADDATSAYGLFTYYQTPAMQPEKGLEFVVSGPNGSLAIRSRLFLRILRPRGKDSEIPDQNFRALLTMLGAASPPTEDMTSLPPSLPPAGLVPGSEKYLLGVEAARRVLPSFRFGLIGFAQGAEVQTGEYSTGKSRSTLMIINYPTPQIAIARFGEMKKVLDINREHRPESVYGKRAGSFIILVLHADSASAANHLLDLFKWTESVTPNQRYAGNQSAIFQMLGLIVANLIFVFILCGWSVVGGIFFFLTKQAARKWFPNSFLGQSDEAAIIRLNLS